MFDAEVYKRRRALVKEQMDTGLLLFPGNDESPMNYAGNAYPFRQDSSFLYYWGLDSPGLMAVIDVDGDRDIIFGSEFTLDDIIWMGPQPTLRERAAKAGVEETAPISELAGILETARQKGRKVHFLPQYRSENLLKMENLLGIGSETLNKEVSEPLIKAVVAQRSVKAPEEVREIEEAVGIGYVMHGLAMKITAPGIIEKEIVGAMAGTAYSMGAGNSFPTIFSIHGETLHNHYYGNRMTEGRLVVNDSGAESALHYASDITRTFPVSGKFTRKQKEIYEIVLEAQLYAIHNIRPGVKYRDVHLQVIHKIAEHLKSLGLVKGDLDAAVEAGAIALFMPHGLGHMMGLDVHDMESLGEDYVGYDAETPRSSQFGLASLRLARRLEPGFVLTVEPGIYFITQLIQRWKAEKKFTQFINYEKLEDYDDFGGIRIEDDVLVTENGNRILGDPIPKTVEEIEELMAK